MSETKPTERDLITEVEELLAKRQRFMGNYEVELLRRLVEEVKRVTVERDEARRKLQLKSRELVAAKGRCHA